MSRPAIVLTALLAAFASTAMAAPVPMAKATEDSIPLPIAKLLKFRSVQRELKMTAEQRIKLVDTLEDIEEEYEKRLDVLQKDPNTQDTAFEKLDKERTKSVEKTLTTTVEKELTAVQRGRLQQLGLQLHGPAAFAEEAVQKKLQLTDPQQKAAKELAEEATQLLGRYITALGNGEEDKARESVVEFRRNGAKKFLDSLTADQQAIWKAISGESVKSFDLTEFWLKHVDNDEVFPKP